MKLLLHCRRAISLTMAGPCIKYFPYLDNNNSNNNNNYDDGDDDKEKNFITNERNETFCSIYLRLKNNKTFF